MITITNWLRMLLVGVALTAFVPVALANAAPTPTSISTNRAESRPDEKQPAGSPEMGVLIIIGVVGFLILIAWIVSRAGDDNRFGGDRSLV